MGKIFLYFEYFAQIRLPDVDNSGPVACWSAPNVLAWAVISRILIWLWALVRIFLGLQWQLYSGLPKDTWELNQQAGRGGRNGEQAAFVIVLWPGQTGNIYIKWSQHTFTKISIYIDISIGGRGTTKSLSRILLKKQQSCQRDAKPITPCSPLIICFLFRAIRSIPDNWIALEEDDLSDEGEVTDLDEAGGNFSDNEVFELY